jgi:hypothetical protein
VLSGRLKEYVPSAAVQVVALAYVVVSWTETFMSAIGEDFVSVTVPLRCLAIGREMSNPDRFPFTPTDVPPML